MSQDEMKKQVAVAALAYVEEDAVIGVGTGSTVNFFIDELATIKHKIDGAVASSVETEKRLKAHGIPVLDLNAAGNVAVYIDGADEFNPYRYLIKGLGGALTREKIIATVARQFVCLVDESKKVQVLGEISPVPVEVLPMARSYVGREIVKLGGDPEYREGCVTDNGNIILDVHNLDIIEPMKLERELKAITGVVENGIFAHRPADVVLMADLSGNISRFDERHPERVGGS